MMFLQFFIWGAWYVTAPNYLSPYWLHGRRFRMDLLGRPDRGHDLAVLRRHGPLTGSSRPKRVLGVLHLAGGAAMFGATMLMKKAKAVGPDMINIYFFGYMLTYFPTLALTNTLAMKNMEDPEKQFPFIRVAGTIGWIVAGFALTLPGWKRRSGCFYLTAGSAIALGLFSFTLPDTPPTQTGPVSFRARSWGSTRWSCWPIPPTWCS
ncbi:MAG: hypothetical protein Ct9H300mP1_07900 [Planctomycetaceae bacterium]|nr:MAG: hypothetical protein Ct9H300mP1_07900 [Planctomycetaceae bacterium]